MDIKKIGLWAGGAIVSLAVMLAAVYFLYPYINPERVTELQANTEKPTIEELRFDAEKYNPRAVDSLSNEVNNLQQTVDSLKKREAGYLSEIDSLKERQTQAEPEKKEMEVKKMEKVAAEKLQNVSKSLLNLDEDSLAPIVNLLEDNQLVGLYSSASNRQRAKLLRSLKPDKAATILKQVL